MIRSGRSEQLVSNDTCRSEESGTQASEIGGFFTGSGDFTAGYGLYLMIIVPVITFICTCVAYGKDKTAEKGKGEE